MAPAPKLPAIQWYPGDWKKDSGVQSLDFYDRGVWWELLQIMHCSARRGVLVWPTGEAMDDDAISQLLGISPEKWKQIRSRLLARGVASVEEETGALYNRRMLRDEELRHSKAEAGRKGGQAKGKQTPSKTQAKRGSSSSSSSSASAVGTPPPSGNSKTEADGVADPKQTGGLPPAEGGEVEGVDAQIVAAVHRWDPTFPEKEIRTQIHRAKKLGVQPSVLLHDIETKGERLRIWTIVDGYQYPASKGNNGHAKVRENAPTERAAVLAEPRDVVQARQDEARKKADQMIEEMDPGELSDWHKEAEAAADKAGAYGPTRNLFVQSWLRKRAGEAFHIEGI